ncbi:hypothetical protein J21TS3_49800 [Paenibacillus cookii]|uniref:Uncharacterized protein n=1 Tax=Paenibacillus cookii TaxID=157839 RepID=A0ABQ4M3Q9_9BACL|nr:hypothetical protein J21TS3_49800 [Paenibacillus cookii]
MSNIRAAVHNRAVFFRSNDRNKPYTTGPKALNILFSAWIASLWIQANFFEKEPYKTCWKPSLSIN